MTGGFEEWAAARTQSLLAFASAIVDDEERADAAVTRALARIRPEWDRVQRADPDLEARRQVVRACAAPRRAAVVLRELEGRSDDEIADILGCSELAARRHVQRGLAEVDARQLTARAGSAPTQLLTRPATGPMLDEPPPRRRRGAWLAALAVIALVGGVAYVSHVSRAPRGMISYPRVDVPQTWRWESYAGVQLRVPDTWGWGASPVTSDHFPGPRHLGACGSNQASVLSPADDATYASVLSGFVGRPAITNERCMSWGAEGSYPAGDAVWFDSPLAVGVTQLGGILAETRAVGSQHVTAFSGNGRLRRQILGSAEQVDVDDNGCPTDPVVRPTAGSRVLQPDSLSVCVYSQDTGVSTLMWSGRLSAEAARAYADAVDSATGEPAASCPTPSGRWVALGLSGAADRRWDLVNLGCLRIQRAGGASAPLTADTVRSWAYGGATAYISAPDRRLASYFQAPTS
jgi:hypothetical protein